MRALPSSLRRTLLLFAVWLADGAMASAQEIAVFGGRLRLAVEASGTIAPHDEGYFNYSDYQTSTLRLARIDLAAEARLAAFASLLADVRSDNLGRPRLYACFLRLVPMPGRAIDVQAGLVPPVFGAYPKRRYAAENPLPSVPLVYQYLTSLRPDAVPASAEELAAARGRGWLVPYSVGLAEPAPGLPLVNAERFDVGVELRLGREPLSLALAVTQGSPSRPRTRDDNDSKQLAGRIAWSPDPSWRLGLSGASGRFLAGDLETGLPEPARGRGRQSAWGADLEWSRGHLILRAESVWSRFTLPPLEETRIESALTALGAFVEARYKLRPGFYAAGRVERLGFGELESGLGSQGWDAAVTRIEAGIGASPRRGVLLKASWQHNRRDGGRVPRNHLAVAQAVLWF